MKPDDDTQPEAEPQPPGGVDPDGWQDFGSGVEFKRISPGDDDDEGDDEKSPWDDFGPGEEDRKLPPDEQISLTRRGTKTTMGR